MEKINLKEQKSQLAKSNAKVVVACIVLALTIVLFVCCTINIADAMEELRESGKYVDYIEFNEVTRPYQIQFAMMLMKHITNMAIAGLIVGALAKKSNDLATEIKNRNVIKLESNTVPCPKCGAEIEREDSGATLICAECGAKYKNPFYKE